MSDLKYPVTIFFSEEDVGHIAIAPDLKGCSAFGETPQEALRELETAIALWLEVAHGDSAPIPEATRMSAYSLSRDRAGAAILPDKAGELLKPKRKVTVIPIERTPT